MIPSTRMRRVCVRRRGAFSPRAVAAHAYEFWLRAQTIGQAYQLREYRLVGPDLFLGRRRITQTLALRIYDIGDLAASRRRSRLPDTRPAHQRGSATCASITISATTSSGRVTLPGPIRRDATRRRSPSSPESVARARPDVRLPPARRPRRRSRSRSRSAASSLDDGWGTTAFDGAAARYRSPGADRDHRVRRACACAPHRRSASPATSSTAPRAPAARNTSRARRRAAARGS